MVAEYYEIAYPHYVGTALEIMVPNISQDLELHECLLVEIIFVPDDLQSSQCLSLVVVDLNHLAEGSTAYCLQQLVTIGDVIVQHILVLVVVVIEYVSLHLVSTVSDEVDLLEFKNLLSLELCQVLLVFA